MVDANSGRAHAGLPRRRRLRLESYDYRSHGAYFVTVTVQHRLPLLGTIEDERVELTGVGSLVSQEWRRIPDRFSGVRLDQWIIMPDHLHGILWLEPEPDRGAGLSEVIGAFKSLSSRACRLPSGGRLWQRSFFDHVIRDDESLAAIRRYIDENPLRWMLRRQRSWP